MLTLLYLIRKFDQRIFRANLLSEIHALLNNMDQLCYIVAKVHKELHPYSQSIMGLAHTLTVNMDNIKGYVRKMSKFQFIFFASFELIIYTLI